MTCTDPGCRFVRAHKLGSFSPRLNSLIESNLLIVVRPVAHRMGPGEPPVVLHGFMNRTTRVTVYLDDLGEAYGFTEHGLVLFASPGEAIGALCDSDSCGDACGGV